jgi:hypothetical protein
MSKTQISLKRANELSLKIIDLLDSEDSDQETGFYALCLTSIIVGRVINGDDDPRAKPSEIQAVINLVQQPEIS